VRPSDANAPAAWPVGVSVGIGASIAAVAFADGGYFATATTWTAVVLALVTTLALALRRRIVIPRGAGIMAAALVGYGVLGVRADVSVQDALRSFAYALAVVALCAVAPSRGGRVLRRLVLAVVGSSTLVVAYGLGTRLFPERLGVFDPIAGYRLSEPLGYWNALGLVAALALVLAVAAAVEPRRSGPLAAATVPVLAMGLYFTFSRGAWLALALGLAVAALASTDRLRFLLAASVLAIPAAAVVGLASRSDALTHQAGTLAAATQQGHRLAAWLLAACATSALTFTVGRFIGRRAVLGRRARRSLWLGYCSGALAITVVVVVQIGNPVAASVRTYESFRSASLATGGDLNQRLFTISGNGRAELWDAALQDWQLRPLSGSGSGTFQRSWLEQRNVTLEVRDAHSLYLETLAELGVVGLALLLAALLMPVFAAIRARRRPFVPAALGAYVAYLAHAGIDWDWEMPAVTLTALCIGAGILVDARDPRHARRTLSPGVRVGAIAVTLSLLGVAFVGLVGNLALTESARAARAGEWNASIDHAERATTWAPWSPEPDRRIGDAELALGRSSRARASYKTAIKKAPRDWSLWFDLARASTGVDRAKSLARASELNPLSPEIAQFRTELRQ
jgi:O-antigen ligase/polysaccharide polymerase Wzy-like membrane protein